MTIEHVTRRSVLQAGAGTAAVAGAALVVGADPAGAAPERVPTYQLDSGPSPAHCHPTRGRSEKSTGAPVARTDDPKQNTPAEQADEARKAAEAEKAEKAEKRSGKRISGAKDDAAGLIPATPEEQAKAEEQANQTRTQERLSTGKRINEPIAAGGCASCSACQRHAENKVFATKEAAERGRAHRRCKCTVVEGPELSPAVYDALFKDNKKKSVDKRDPKVAELIANSDASGVPVPILAPTVPILAALAGGFWWWRSSRGRTNPTT